MGQSARWLRLGQFGGFFLFELVGSEKTASQQEEKNRAFGEFRQRISRWAYPIGTNIVIFYPSKKIQKILLRLGGFRGIIYRTMQ